MSATAVVHVQTPAFIDAPVTVPSADDRLNNLVHELRQPLSSIEAIAYYLEMTLPVGQTEARQYMSQLQRLVADASAILERSVEVPRKDCARIASAR